MATEISLQIIATDRASYRRQLVNAFLNENPGSATSVTEYNYFVDMLQNGDRIYLKRPTALNKGVDFEVRVENTQFRYGKHHNIISTGNRPSHKDIADDLIAKKQENPAEFVRLKILLDKTFRCEPINRDDFLSYRFTTGHSVELIFKSLKWLFIEQDITYWNRSGRYMLYEGLRQIWPEE